MAEQQQGGSGFVLPAPGSQTPATAVTSLPPNAAGAPLIAIKVGQEDTSSRDLLVGGGILLLLLVAFFLARMGYANMLVGKKVPPSKANAAGWWLFVFLSSISIAVVLTAMNPARFLNLLTVGPLAVVAVAGLVLMLVSGRR